MNRRTLLKSAVSAAGLTVAGRQVVHAAIPKMKITRVRVYSPERPNPLFNQSDLVVTVETDAGVTGIGEGGARDTLEQSAGRLIGQDPQYIERLWQDMTRAFFWLYSRIYGWNGLEGRCALGARFALLRALQQNLWAG